MIAIKNLLTEASPCISAGIGWTKEAKMILTSTANALERMAKDNSKSGWTTNNNEEMLEKANRIRKFLAGDRTSSGQLFGNPLD